MCVVVCSGHLESLVGRCSLQGRILILDLTHSLSSDTWREERDWRDLSIQPAHKKCKYLIPDSVSSHLEIIISRGWYIVMVCTCASFCPISYMSICTIVFC